MGAFGFPPIVGVARMAAALWHMAWWIGVVFVAMVVASQGVVFGAMVSSGSTTTWRTPAGAEEPGPARNVPGHESEPPSQCHERHGCYCGIETDMRHVLGQSPSNL